MPTQEHLAEYYAETFAHFYGKYNVADQCDLTFSKPERLANHIAAVIPMARWEKSPVHIIDFGGGDGTLGTLLARQLPQTISVKITVVDYGEKTVSIVDDRVELIKEENLDNVREQAHIIIASASLEHVPHAEPVIRKLLALLAPEGYLYARTPYIMPMKKLIPSIDFGYPAHIHDMGADFWNRLPDIFDNDFSIIKSRPSIVEVVFGVAPFRCIISHVMKLPARLECFLWPRKKWLLWPFVGGWEIFLQKRKLDQKGVEKV